MPEKSIKKNTVLNVIKNLMGLLFPLITFPYATRVLLPEGIGKVQFAQSIVSYFLIIASLGVETYAVREASKVREDRKALSGFAKEILTINMISTFVAYSLLFVVVFFVDRFFEYRSLIIVCSTSILFITVGMEWLFRAVEDYGYITVRAIVFQLISLALLFIFVRDEGDSLKYAAIGVFSSVGSNTMNFIHGRKYISLFQRSEFHLKKHLKPIFTLFAMGLAVKVYQALDTTMVGLIKGDFEVGIYAAATKMNRVVVTLIMAISTVMTARLSYYFGKNDMENFKSLAEKGVNFSLMMAFPCAVGLTVLSTPVVNLLCGEKYVTAIIPMMVMNPIIVIVGLSNFIGNSIFIPLGKEKYTLYVVLIGAVVNFLMNMLLIPKYGALGAAIGTVCAEGSVTVAEVIILSRILNIGNSAKHFLLYLCNSVVMGCAVYFTVFKIESDILSLLIGIVVGVVVYGVLLIVERNSFVMEVLEKVKSILRRSNVKE